MVATPIPSPVRFSKTLNSTIYIVPTIANISAPTRTELDAGIRIDGVVPKDGVAGFAGSEVTVTADDLMTGYTLPIHDGIDWSSGSTITGYLSHGETATGTGASDIRTVMATGTNVYVVLFDTIDSVGLTMDVFPCFIGAQTKSRSGVATVEIACTFTGVPALNVAVPAASA